MDAEYETWLENRETLTQQRSHPNHWRNRAEDLKASAGALWHSMGPQDSAIASALGYQRGFQMSVACWPIYHMLCGLSLELIMKAVLSQRGVSPVDFRGHRFDRLHQLLKIPLKKDRATLMRFYEASLVWAGRYPLPIDANDEKLLNYFNLANDVLTKSADIGAPAALKFKVASGATDWENFSTLSESYAALFLSK